MSSTLTYKILHLSDLHFGMADQELYWSNLNAAFRDDLVRMHSKQGPWDLVLFSGDLVQRGSAAEFGKVEAWLADLWKLFNELGFSPQFLSLPGNHDLQRPSGLSPEAIALRSWFSLPELRSEFFSTPTSAYRTFIDNSFSGYSGFTKRLATSTIGVAPTKSGLLPGDEIGVLEKDGLKVGLVTLNSTWLQLEQGDYVGKLDVDLRQLHSLEPDVYTWHNANHFNLVVTHQPVGWLHSSSIDMWNSEMSPPGRFDLHLFGHMHETDQLSVAKAGSSSQSFLQAPSLFGVESDEKGVRRIHGYSLLSLELEGDIRRISIWPRIQNKVGSGERVFAANSVHFKLDDRDAFTIELPKKALPKAIPQVVTPTSQTLQTTPPKSGDVLKQLRYHLRTSQSHRNVRRIEREQVSKALSTSRVTWLVGEWGVGSDEFLEICLQHSGKLSASTFRIDGSAFEDREGFTAELSETVKVSFAQLCDVLDGEERILILDDLRVGAEPALGVAPVEKEIEELATLFIDTCPSLSVVLRSRQIPRNAGYSVVQIGPLDEADVKAYIEAHESGLWADTDSATVGVLYRLSDGYPTRLDTNLKTLAVTSLEDLAASNADYATPESATVASVAIARSVSELSESQDQSLNRAYSMLLALAVFPRGAEFSRVRRFHGTIPFHVSDVTALTDRALAEVIEVTDFGKGEASPPSKTLVVPRPVRDYLRDRLDNDDLISLNIKAADLLLGPKWRSGSTKWPKDLNYESPKCRASDVANASALIVRLFRLYRDSQPETTASLIALSAGFARSLVDGSHYTSAVNFCQDLLPLLSEADPEELRSALLRHYSSALRMLGDRAKAKKLCRQLLETKLSKAAKRSVMLDLALILETDNDPEALKVARDIMALSKQGSAGFQAESIIIEAEAPSPDRTRRLKELEEKARKKKFFVVADNLALVLADEAKTAEESSAFLQKVISSADGEVAFYNASRAVIKVVETKQKEKKPLSDFEIQRLIDTYQFLLNERVPWMFDRVNASLWKAFVERNWFDNLLSLYRYSSIIWRLRGTEQKEESYLQVLLTIRHQLEPLLLLNSKEAQYFQARIAHFGLAPTLELGVTKSVIT